MTFDIGTALQGAAGIASLMGGGDGYSHQMERWNRQNQRNWERQFGESVQARVADAKKAGISPLAALGVSGSSLPSFSTGSGARRGSPAATALERLGVEHSAAQVRKTEAEANQAYAQTQRTQAATAALEYQLAKQKADEYVRNLTPSQLTSWQLHPSGARTRGITFSEPGSPVSIRDDRRLDMFRWYHDNSGNFPDLAGADIIAPSEELAEALDNLAGRGLAIYGNRPDNEWVSRPRNEYLLEMN